MKSFINDHYSGLALPFTASKFIESFDIIDTQNSSSPIVFCLEVFFEQINKKINDDNHSNLIESTRTILLSLQKRNTTLQIYKEYSQLDKEIIISAINLKNMISSELEWHRFIAPKISQIEKYVASATELNSNKQNKFFRSLLNGDLANVMFISNAFYFYVNLRDINNGLPAIYQIINGACKCFYEKEPLPWIKLLKYLNSRGLQYNNKVTVKVNNSKNMSLSPIEYYLYNISSDKIGLCLYIEFFQLLYDNDKFFNTDQVNILIDRIKNHKQTNSTLDDFLKKSNL